jgi:GNAT superfamily N-acetyltransferase
LGCHAERPSPGFASVWTNDNFLHNLFVDPQYQSHGVGKMLLEQVQKTFTSTGSLKCLVKNARAVAFYQRHGWHIEATGDSPDGEYYLMHYRLGKVGGASLTRPT